MLVLPQKVRLKVRWWTCDGCRRGGRIMIFAEVVAMVMSFVDDVGPETQRSLRQG